MDNCARLLPRWAVDWILARNGDKEGETMSEPLYKIGMVMAFGGLAIGGTGAIILLIDLVFKCWRQL